MEGISSPLGVGLNPPSIGDSASITVADSLSTLEDPEKALTPRLSRIFEEPARSGQALSIATADTHHPEFEVDWDGEDDPTNPLNWPLWYKGLTIAFMSWGTWVVVVYSTSYTLGISRMQADLNASSQPIVTLGITTYLIGLAIGSVIVAPLSEMCGRRPVYMVSMLLFTLLIIPCGLATTITEVLAVRFVGALAGSVMIVNSAGTLSDIVTDEYRALVFSMWSIGPLNGPTFGPIIGGFSTQ